MVTRIIAGSLASRRIATPAGPATRPTTDRVRESVFSYLASYLGVVNRVASEQLSQCRFLDLYAGSGAVGLEALSRGAEVTWVDKHTARLIKQNLETLSVHGEVLGMDVAKFLVREPTSFNIIWMDPPYEMPNDLVEAILGQINTRGWLCEPGCVLVERSGHSSAVEFPESFLKVSTRRYGDTVIFHAEKGSQ